MFAQQNQLKEIFRQNGWELIETYKPERWWIADSWVIKSLWTPTDCKIYLRFFVDPHLAVPANENPSAKLNVWDIQFSLKDPNELGYLEFLNEDEHFTVSIKSQWEKQIPEVVEGLDKLRNKFNKFICGN